MNSNRDPSIFKKIAMAVALWSSVKKLVRYPSLNLKNTSLR
jgi:hypothetical protein